MMVVRRLPIAAMVWFATCVVGAVAIPGSEERWRAATTTLMSKVEALEEQPANCNMDGMDATQRRLCEQYNEQRARKAAAAEEAAEQARAKKAMDKHNQDRIDAQKAKMRERQETRNSERRCTNLEDLRRRAADSQAALPGLLAEIRAVANSLRDPGFYDMVINDKHTYARGTVGEERFNEMSSKYYKLMHPIWQLEDDDPCIYLEKTYAAEIKTVKEASMGIYCDCHDTKDSIDARVRQQVASAKAAMNSCSEDSWCSRWEQEWELWLTEENDFPRSLIYYGESRVVSVGRKGNPVDYYKCDCLNDKEEDADIFQVRKMDIAKSKVLKLIKRWRQRGGQEKEEELERAEAIAKENACRRSEKCMQERAERKRREKERQKRVAAAEARRVEEEKERKRQAERRAAIDALVTPTALEVVAAPVRKALEAYHKAHKASKAAVKAKAKAKAKHEENLALLIVLAEVAHVELLSRQRLESHGDGFAKSIIHPSAPNREMDISPARSLAKEGFVYNSKCSFVNDLKEEYWHGISQQYYEKIVTNDPEPTLVCHLITNKDTREAVQLFRDEAVRVKAKGKGVLSFKSEKEYKAQMERLKVLKAQGPAETGPLAALGKIFDELINGKKNCLIDHDCEQLCHGIEMDKFEGYHSGRHQGKSAVIFNYMLNSQGHKVSYEIDEYNRDLYNAENKEAAGFFKEDKAMTKAHFCATRVVNKCENHRCKLALKTLYGTMDVKI